MSGSTDGTVERGSEPETGSPVLKRVAIVRESGNASSCIPCLRPADRQRITDVDTDSAAARAPFQSRDGMEGPGSGPASVLLLPPGA